MKHTHKHTQNLLIAMNKSKNKIVFLFRKPKEKHTKDKRKDRQTDRHMEGRTDRHVYMHCTERHIEQ